jgi:NAD(P)-dependent dehydrogenase (short-subunit alcohol dehydrogenase family)
MSAERLRRMFDVNLLGPFFCAREAARRMSTRRGGKGGVIINISSGAAQAGSPNAYIDYAACKGAIETLTIGLAKELGPEGVRVNTLRAGFVDTEIHASAGDASRGVRAGKTTPMGRAGQPQELAEAIVWLLSDAASYVSNAALSVSGGM